MDSKIVFLFLIFWGKKVTSILVILEHSQVWTLKNVIHAHKINTVLTRIENREYRAENTKNEIVAFLNS